MVPLGFQQTTYQIHVGELWENLIGLEGTVSSAHTGLLIPARMENFMILWGTG